MRNAGVEEQQARRIITDRASEQAALLQGTVAAFGGAFTAKLVMGRFDKVLSGVAKTRLGRIAIGVGIGSAEEGTQEFLEGIAADLGINKEVVREIGQESFANLLLGMLGGGMVGGVRGAISPPREESPDEAIAKELDFNIRRSAINEDRVRDEIIEALRPKTPGEIDAGQTSISGRIEPTIGATTVAESAPASQETATPAPAIALPLVEEQSVEQSTTVPVNQTEDSAPVAQNMSQSTAQDPLMADLENLLAGQQADASGTSPEDAAPAVSPQLQRQVNIGTQGSRFVVFESPLHTELFDYASRLQSAMRTGKTPDPLTRDRLAQAFGVQPEDINSFASAYRDQVIGGARKVDADGTFNATAPGQQSPLLQEAVNQINGVLANRASDETIVAQEVVNDDRLSKIARAIKSAFGVDLVFFDGGADGSLRTNKGRSVGRVHGYRIAGKSAVMVNVRSYKILDTIGHELTHVLETKFPSLYRKLLEVAKTSVPQAQQDKLRSDLNALASADAQSETAVDEREFESELVAYTIGEQASDPRFWLDVFAGQESSAVSGFIDYLQKAMDALLKVLQGPKYAADRKAALAVRKAAVEAFQTWSKQEQANATDQTNDSQPESGQFARAPDRNRGKSEADPVATSDEAYSLSQKYPSAKTRKGRCHELSVQKVIFEFGNRYSQVLGVVKASPVDRIWHSVVKDAQTGSLWEPISNRWHTPQAMDAFGFEPVLEKSAAEVRKEAGRSGVYPDQINWKPRGYEIQYMRPGDYNPDYSITGYTPPVDRLTAAMQAAREMRGAADQNVGTSQQAPTVPNTQNAQPERGSFDREVTQQDDISFDFAKNVFLRVMRSDPTEMVKEYVETYGRNVNPDLARELHPMYLQNPAFYAAAVHEGASKLAKASYRFLLENKRPNDRVVMLAGGGGSGKGFAAKRLGITDASGVPVDDVIIYDSVLGKFEQAQLRIEEALAAGLPVEMVYVNSPADTAFGRALDRAQRTNRIVPLNVLADAHVGASNTIRRVSQEYGDRVDIRVANAADNVVIGSLDDVPQYNYEDLVRQFTDILNTRERNGYPKELADNFRRQSFARELDESAGETGAGAERVRGGAGAQTDRQGSEPQRQPARANDEQVNPLASYVAQDDAEARVRRRVNRKEGVGLPTNYRIAFGPKGAEFVVGRISTQDWVDRVNRLLPKQELADSRRWYQQLNSALTPIYGDKSTQYALAWLLSQKRASPTKGMTDVLRASDMASGKEEVKKAGLNQAALIDVLQGRVPEEGIGAKLLDFIDSELGKTTRTVVRDDPRGRQPAAIDVWAQRDIGFVDPTVFEFVRKQYGEESVQDLTIDKTSTGESQYEYGIDFYNDLVDYLNSTNYDGGGWTAREVQAVGWVTMQRAMNIQAEFVRDIIGGNTRRVSIGLAPGSDSVMAGKLAGKEIPVEVAQKEINYLAKLSGVNITQNVSGVGAYLSYIEGSVQIDAFGSPESAADFMDMVGYAFQQTEVINTSPLKSGKNMAIDVMAEGFQTVDQSTSFFSKLLESMPTDKNGDPLAPGFQQIVIDGVPGIRLLNFGGNWRQTQIAEIQNALNAVSEQSGVQLQDVVVKQVTLTSTKNDWKESPNGEAYLDSLRNRGRLQEVGELQRRYTPSRFDIDGDGTILFGGAEAGRDSGAGAAEGSVTRSLFSRENIEKMATGAPDAPDGLILGRVPAVLRAVGVPDLPLIITRDKVTKITDPERFGKATAPRMFGDRVVAPRIPLTAAQLYALPDLIANPVAILRSSERSTTGGKGLVIMTTAKVDGYPVIVTLAEKASVSVVNGERAQEMQVAEITTALPKNQTIPSRGMQLSPLNRDLAQNALYFNGVRAAQLAQGLRLSLPRLRTGSSNANVLKPQDIVNEYGEDPFKFERIDAPIQQIRNARRFSRELIESEKFQLWFGDSKIVNEDGTPKIMYHGTARDIFIFRPKQAQAIFVTESPGFAEQFASGSEFYMVEQLLENDSLVQEIERKTISLWRQRNPDAARADVAEVRANPREQSEFYEIAKQYLDSNANILPVYIKAEKPFDYERDADIQAVLDQMNAVLRFTEDEVRANQARRIASGDWSIIETDYAQRYIKAAGFDAFYVKEGGQKNLAVYEPNQIKSAIGNSGEFNPQNPDIRFSRSLPQRNGWEIEETGRKDNFIYLLQDKQIDLKRVIQGITTASGQLSEQWNAYMQEELFHGRAAKRVKDFAQLELNPLLRKMSKYKIDIVEFDNYMHARHAKEANAQVASVNPQMQDGGSGLTNQQADDLIKNLTADKRAQLEELHKDVMAMTKQTREMMVDYGIEARPTIDAWESAYQNYVPLFREGIESGSLGIGQGYSIQGSSSKRRLGSSKSVIDVLANIAMQRERTIARGEKNRVAIALYGLAVQNPSEDFWMPINPETTNTPVAQSSMMATLQSMGIDPINAANIAGLPMNRVLDQRTGIVTLQASPNLKSLPNVLMVRINGRDRALLFNTNNERAARMVSALKNFDANQMGQAVSMMGTAGQYLEKTKSAVGTGTRYFAAVNTQYNPIFGLINFIRDASGATINLSNTPIANKRLQVLSQAFPALFGIYKDLRLARKGLQPSSKWSALFDEFELEGGKTGFRDLFARADERTKALEAELKRVSEGGVMTAGRAVLDWLSDFNEAIENAIRLSAYKTAKEQGMSKQKAASLAKNLTVNFNRKGAVSADAAILYAFFNASVQGTARIADTVTTEDGKSLSPVGKTIIGGGMLLGVMQAVLLAMAGFEEDEPKDFIKDKNLIIPTGMLTGKEGTYFAIPMPLGYNAIPAFARRLTELAMSDNPNYTKALVGTAGMILDAFNPLGSATLGQTIAPTVLDPMVALIENRDFSGRPIAREDMSGMDPTPGYTRAKENASSISKGLSYVINLLTGGTDYKQGALSPTPDQLDYLIGQITGGVGRELIKVGKTGEALVTGEDLATYNIPVVGRFVGSQKQRAMETSRFYDNVKLLNEHQREIEGREKDEKDTSKYLEKNPEAELYKASDKIYRRTLKLKKQRKELKAAGAGKEELQEYDDAILDTMRELNEAVKSAKSARD
jgi:hypothetical protein